MTENSVLERLLAFFLSSHSPGMQMLPSILFHVLALGLTFAGWRRHRATGFLLLFAAWSLGLLADFVYLRMISDSGGSTDSMHLIPLARAMGYIAFILIGAGLWHLVYRTRLLPSEAGRE